MPRKHRPIWTLDCETDPFRPGRVPQPFLWGVYDGENFQYWQFEAEDKLVDFLREQSAIVYAHNGGKFDYHYLRKYIDHDSPISVIAGRLAKFTIGACEFRDSLNLFGQTRLKDFAKQEIDYKLFEKEERYKPENWKLICEYQKSDCVNLWNLVNAFIERYGLQFTQAGASMKYWSKKYKKPAPQSTRHFYDTYHPFYYGGRVQCFKSGHQKEDGKMYDINSAYPRAMCDEHPYSTDALVTRKLPTNPERLGPCLIELSAVSHGALPKFDPDTQGLYFPNDKDTRQKREYSVTGWEVMAGLDTGTLEINEIFRVHEFTETTNFKDYIRGFYDERKLAKANGDKAGDIFAKIFMNSLYGKFAANPRKYQEYVIPSEEMLEKWLKKGYFRDGNWEDREIYTRHLPEEKHRYYNIATAASITGWVRAYLWRALCCVDDPVYCDTDSIVCRDGSALPLGAELGQWKLECEIDEWAIAGKKTYALHKTPAYWKSRDIEPESPWAAEWKVASKGVRLTPEEIIAAAGGIQFTYLTQVPNYSIHASQIDFIHRLVRNTYKDVSVFPEHSETLEESVA